MKKYEFLTFVILTFISFCSISYSQTPSWKVQNSGLADSPNPALILSAVDSNICWGILGEFYHPTDNPKCVLTTDGGLTWSILDMPGLSGLQGRSLFAFSASTAYAALFDPSLATSGGIFKTTDGGLTWVKQSTAFPGAGGFPVSIYFFDADNGLCTGRPRNGYWEIYTTSDGGTNWTRVPSSNIPAIVPGEIGGVGKGSGNSFWFNSSQCSVYRSTDRGLTWSVTRNIFTPTSYFLELAFKDTLNGLAISYYNDHINKVSKSSDGGITWTRLSAPPSIPSFANIEYIPGTSESYIVTSMSNIGFPEPANPGSVYTPDGGLTWIPIDNLAHGSTSFIDNKTGWSAGRGDTIFKWNGYPLGINKLNPDKTTATLSQNYPNPFSLSTLIIYHIPYSSRVNLTIYDIRGSEVANLVDEEKSPGSYSVTFQPGRQLKGGIYYYRLQVGESSQTKKLCIMPQ